MRRPQLAHRLTNVWIEIAAPRVKMSEYRGTHAGVPEFFKMIDNRVDRPFKSLTRKELADLICRVSQFLRRHRQSAPVRMSSRRVETFEIVAAIATRVISADAHGRRRRRRNRKKQWNYDACHPSLLSLPDLPARCEQPSTRD